MTQKKRPGIAGRAPRPSVVAGSTVARTAKKTVKKLKANPPKEYNFPSEFAPELLIAGLLLTAVIVLLFV